MQKVSPDQKAEMGHRIKKAAEEAGLSGYAIAKRLKVHFPTVYRWLRGDRMPAPALLQAYADLVGKPVAYFYGQEEENERPQEVADLLLAWAERLMAGEEPGRAFDRVTGEPTELGPPERQQLASAAAAMREDLIQASGGDWDLLTEPQRRQILRQIARMAEERRAAASRSS